MIPISLTLQGLYSYRGRQTIDFTKLTRDGLFGIFGSVGSGKSSILEAISFALYEETERLNSRDNRNYNMMNLKSNELLIDFEFSSNNNSVYRFLVRGKRNVRKFEDVKSFDRTAYIRDGLQWLPIDPKSIEEITGLNYKNFRRTIIIPQGRFQEFLQLNATDRTTMLKELFSLSKYELSIQVGRLESKNNAAIQKVQGQLVEVGEVKPERIGELKDKIKVLKVLIVELKKEVDQSQLLDQELDTLKVLTGKITEQKGKLETLQNNTAFYDQLEKEVKEYESFSLIFKSDLDQMKVVEDNLLRGVGELEKNNLLLADFQNKYTALKAVFDVLKVEYEAKEKLLQESEEIKKYLEIRRDEALIKTAGQRLENGKTKVQENLNLIAIKRLAIKANEEKLITFKENLPNLKVLSEISEWFLKQRNLFKSQHELQTKLNTAVEEQKQLFRLKQESMDSSKSVFVSLDNAASIGEMLSAIERSGSEIEVRKKSLEEEILALEIQHQLEKYASDLHDGVPCPLCGSENHPSILNPQNVAIQLVQLKQQKAGIEAIIKDHLKLDKQLADLQTRLAANETLQTMTLHEIQLINEQLTTHAKLFRWKGFEEYTEAFIRNEFERHDVLQKQIADTEKHLKEDSSVIETEERNREKYTRALSDIEQEITGSQLKIQLLISQIKLIDLQHYAAFSGLQLESLIQDKNRKFASLIQQYQQLEQEITGLSAKINTLTGIIESNLKTNLNLEEQKEALRERIDLKLIESGNPELSTVMQILARSINIGESKRKIETYKQEVELIRKYLEELTTDLKGRNYNPGEHAILKQQVHEKKEALDVQNQSLWNHENELGQLELLIKRYAVLQAENEQLKLRGQDIAELKSLFRSSSFVNYVSTVYLQNLCKAANERFQKLTRQKLGLELQDDNSFYVRDYMNEGKLRSVKTLSGGQTFQASLSLALSLADSIHKIAGSAENFFFLDEGFGTLDKESLDVVFESLKALRKENRIVGVISHVEDMQQEIETFLKVTNNEELGSQIFASWDI